MSEHHSVITGGVGAIGLATTARLLSSGHRVTAFDIVPEEEAAARLARLDAGDRVSYCRVDVAESGVEAALRAAAPFDAVIGNAGIGPTARFVDVSQSDWDRTLAVNLTGNFRLGQAAARILLETSRPGSIVFVSSWIGERPWPETTAYSASKAGLEMLARSMALELAGSGVRVNVVAPGILGEGLAGDEARTNPEYAARAARAVPLGRLQGAEDVAGVIAFLCSPEAAYLTGARIVADGGCSLLTGGGT